MGREFFIKRIAEIQLRKHGWTHCVRLFVDLDNVACDILNQIVVTTPGNAGPNPGKELPGRTLVVSPRFGKFLASNLDIEVLRAG